MLIARINRLLKCPWIATLPTVKENKQVFLIKYLLQTLYIGNTRNPMKNSVFVGAREPTDNLSLVDNSIKVD